MPFNGSGTYSAPSLPGTWNPAQSGSSIDPTDWNTLLTDLATALSKQICNDGQTTITANIPFAGHRITGLGDPVGGQDGATKNYADNAPWSYLGGLTTSRASATTLAVAAGKCNDSTNTSGSTIYLPSGMTKSTAGAWASGNNSNGMGNGLTIANGTWYHVFAIINTGVADVYFDTSVTAANKPTGTTAFRRVGSFKTDGSAQILAFTQTGDKFQWGTIITETPGVGAGPTLQSLLGVPPGVVTTAILSVTLSTSAGGAGFMQVTTPGVSTASIVTACAGSSLGYAEAFVDTNTSNQVNFTYTNVGNIIASSAFTVGWIDSRGKNA